MQRVNTLGVGVCHVSMAEAVEAVIQMAKSGESHYVCVSNVHTVMMCQQNPEYLRIHNEAAMVVPDGRPLGWFQQLQGYNQRERVYGPDLMLAVCERSVAEGFSHYLYGGREGVPEKLAQTLQARFPGLKVAGCYSPPFRALTPEEDEADVKRINESGADILWVGLGAPKQELWMGRHFRRVNVPVMLGVGAAFDFHTGLVRQAPNWMQRSGLEWLFRFWVEPRRMWRRYVFNNPAFLVLAACQLLGLKNYPPGATLGRSTVR